ncbi:hypothetical protein K488DRAFT_80108 [Vararia minispora EC-137]|uniref:Uncharacterized protein n=1 Tax=Vararia minispora EC-137 TaxID=1314806 RepID=A0ACB8QD29_9AGAM|nr:hypothetical protein K488DRAFT_80108 [Vararia minispora EC-137]
MSSPKDPLSSPSAPHHPAADQSSAAQQRPVPRPKRSNLDQEPNPFEQSFSRPPNPTSSIRSSARPDSTESQSHDDRRPPSAHSSAERKSGSPKPTLPPLASINSPSDQYPWGSALANSLRSGPLSPAMLAGPAQSNPDSALGPFDPSGFRLTPRSGLTPGTGLTPLLGGPVSFPPPSPGTAAFLNMMNNPGAGSGPTITPNTLNAITGVLSSTAANVPAATAQAPHPLSVSHVPYDRPNGSQPNGQENYAQSAANATTTAANGLFLLSQAHQELTKREEAQRAGQQAQQQQQQSPQMQSSPVQNGRRGTKRKQTLDEAHSPPDNKPAPAKRTRQSTQSLPQTRAKQQTPSVDEDEEEEEEDFRLEPSPPAGKKGQQKKPETEEEKRKNFLERNRQAALKCRQRKKAWLAQLQAKVEFLTQENERLQAALVSAREEIARLSATAVMPVQGTNHGGAPVSVNVALPQGQKVAAGGRGYGY